MFLKKLTDRYKIPDICTGGPYSIFINIDSALRPCKVPVLGLAKAIKNSCQSRALARAAYRKKALSEKVVNRTVEGRLPLYLQRNPSTSTSSVKITPPPAAAVGAAGTFS